jgi:hypothetical protein
VSLIEPFIAPSPQIVDIDRSFVLGVPDPDAGGSEQRMDFARSDHLQVETLLPILGSIAPELDQPGLQLARRRHPRSVCRTTARLCQVSVDRLAVITRQTADRPRILNPCRFSLTTSSTSVPTEHIRPSSESRIGPPVHPQGVADFSTGVIGIFWHRR